MSQSLPFWALITYFIFFSVFTQMSIYKSKTHIKIMSVKRRWVLSRQPFEVHAANGTRELMTGPILQMSIFLHEVSFKGRFWYLEVTWRDLATSKICSLNKNVLLCRSRFKLCTPVFEANQITTGKQPRVEPQYFRSCSSEIFGISLEIEL